MVFSFDESHVLSLVVSSSWYGLGGNFTYYECLKKTWFQPKIKLWTCKLSIQLTIIWYYDDVDYDEYEYDNKHDYDDDDEKLILI